MTAAGRKAAPAYTLGTLFGLAKDLGLASGDAKEAAYSLIGKDSLKKFTQAEINEVCFEFMTRKDGRKRSAGRVTAGQLFKIREYEQLLGWDENPLRLARFIEKCYHTASVLWLTPAQAGKLIESLKSMLEREQKKEVSGDGNEKV